LLGARAAREHERVVPQLEAAVGACPAAQLRRSSAAQVNRMSAVASGKVTRTVAVSSTESVACRRRSSRALSAWGRAPIQRWTM
jgi:hypothetical protein